MTLLTLPSHLEDKIFELKYTSDETVSKIISYFPLSNSEIREILLILNDDSFNEFHSIFTDNLTVEEWENSKQQIKKKFKDELFDIDKIS